MNNQTLLNKRVADEVHSLIKDGYRKVVHVNLGAVALLKLRHRYSARQLSILVNYQKSNYKILDKGRVKKIVKVQ